MKYQVEYMSRPDERDHVVPFGTDYRKACAFAREMSDAHDGIAYVVALAERDRAGVRLEEAVGHAVYVFGMRDHTEGKIRCAAKPATVQE